MGGGGVRSRWPWERQREAGQEGGEGAKHLSPIEVQQQPHLHGGHMQGLVPKLHLRPAQPCPLQPPRGSHIQGLMVLT